MRVVNIHSPRDTRQVVDRLVLPREDMVLMASLKSDYLVSAGQTITFGVSLTETGDRAPEPGDQLLQHDARGVVHLNVPVFWDYRWIPSQRTLSDILADAVRHGVEQPTHGTDCVCMDKLMYEIRQHISKALPVNEREDISTSASPDDWQGQYDARSRVKHILMVAARNL